MNPLLQALSSGYSKEQILKHITRAFPDLAKKITKATAAGYSIDKIFNLMAKTSQPEQTGRMYQSERHAKMTEEQRQIGKNIAKTGLGIAGTALASKAVPTMLQNVGQKLGLLATPSPMNQTPGQQIGQNIQQGQQPGQIPQLPGPTPNQPSGPTPGQPPVQPITQEQINNAPKYQPEFDFLKRRNLVPKIQSMVKAGKSKEQIVEMLKKKMPMMEQEALRTLGPGGREVDLDTKLGNIVDKFFTPQQNVPRGTEENVESQNLLKPTELVEKPIEEEFPKIDSKSAQKGETVITESGDIGIIKGISGHKALIEENGKLKQVPIEQLRGQPEAIRNSKVIFDPSAIPEEDRSAALAFVLPLPDKMSIIDIFHNGKPYLYKRKDGKPFDESIIRRMIDGTDIPLTSGDTFMGAWNTEKGDSRGSANHKELVARAQKAGEPDDPTKDLIYEEIDDSYIHGYYKELISIFRSFSKAYASKPKKPKKG